jgi:Bacterial SH3 domain
MSSFLISVLVSAVLGTVPLHAYVSSGTRSGGFFAQREDSSPSNSQIFQQYFKDNAPKSTRDQEAVLLKKEQELLAAEQALLAKEQLFLKGSTATNTTANSSTQTVVPPLITEPQQESVVPERARLATPQISPKQDIAASATTSSPPTDETTKVPTQNAVQATNTTGDIPVIAAIDKHPQEEVVPETKKEASAKTLVSPTPAQQPAASSEELEALRKRTSSLEGELAELRKRLASKEHSIGEKDQAAVQAVRELNETKARLMLAETQVERLSSIIEARNDCTISQLTGETRQRPIPATVSRLPVVPKVESSAEMPIATVVKKKVYLRTGPGKNNSPLMAVSEGTRLAVETMQGEWYRVITPTGARAWVAAESIAFGNGGSIAPARSVEQSEEDKAFELLKQR